MWIRNKQINKKIHNNKHFVRIYFEKIRKKSVNIKIHKSLLELYNISENDAVSIFFDDKDLWKWLLCKSEAGKEYLGQKVYSRPYGSFMIINASFLLIPQSEITDQKTTTHAVKYEITDEGLIIYANQPVIEEKSDGTDV